MAMCVSKAGGSFDFAPNWIKLHVFVKGWTEPVGKETDLKILIICLNESQLTVFPSVTTLAVEPKKITLHKVRSVAHLNLHVQKPKIKIKCTEKHSYRPIKISPLVD